MASRARKHSRRVARLRAASAAPAAPAGPQSRDGKTAAAPAALDENIRAIRTWERAARWRRSALEQFSDRVTGAAASGRVLLAHVAWFGLWIAANTGVMPFVAPFDPFPFQLLTLAVSLEAIFLSMFVLASQNRLAAQADKRENLDLQIDLLAEQEMTTVLQLLRDIARRLDVKTSVGPGRIRDLATRTDIQRVTDRIETTDPSSSEPRA